MFASLLTFFTSKKVEDDETYIRFTYRSNIKKVLPTTYYDSDTGWGCMLRVTQMAIANLLFKKEQAKIHTIAPLFWDNSEMPFSLQSLTNISKTLYPHKKEFQWYTPCEAGFIFKRALENFNLTYNVAVCNDNSIFLSQIPTDKQNIVILIMSRIGLDKAEKDYLQTLTQMMASKYFFSILGGTPRYAHLFFKQKNGYFGYIDPHETRKCPEELEEVLSNATENIGKLEWIKRQKISSSMCIMYLCKREELGNFWEELRSLKDKLGEKFFLYMEESRPEMNSDDGIFEIIDIDEATK